MSDALRRLAGKRAKAARKEIGWTLDEASKRTKIARSRLHDLETQQDLNLTLDLLARLGKAYGKEPAWFITPPKGLKAVEKSLGQMLDGAIKTLQMVRSYID